MIVGADHYSETMSAKKSQQQVVEKQNVYSFQALFPSTYKPDAHIFYLQLEDIKLILTKGVSKHGEWFFSGKRLPRTGGHKDELPEGSEIEDIDEAHAQALLPDRRLDHMIAYTDGCQAQFGGRNSFGRVAEQIHEKYTEVPVKTTLTKTTPYHGKSICDGLSNVPANALRRAGQQMPDRLGVGTRAQVRPNLPFFSPFPRHTSSPLACMTVLSKQVLFLAENVKEPSVPKNKKPDWWAVTGFLWGYINPETILPKPDFKTLSGSKSMFIFQTADPHTDLARSPTIHHRRRLCLCVRCRPTLVENSSQSKLGSCEVRQPESKFKDMVGWANRHLMIRVKDQAKFKRQTRSNLEKEKEKAAETEGEDLEHIETFAGTFKIGEVVAVAVQADEQLDFSNTDFYLAVVEEKPVKLKKAKRFQGNLLEAGRWVFTGRWLEFVREDENTGVRHYQIMSGDLVQHDVGVVLRMPDKDDPVNSFFFVGSMNARRKVGSTFKLAAESVQYILECIAKDAAREAAESEAAASTRETASVMDTLIPG